jgi:hypothetical protein
MVKRETKEAPGVEYVPALGIPRPPAPFSDPLLLALRSEGDQPMSVEMPLGDGQLTLTIGIRNVYVRMGGRHVQVIPCRTLDTSEVT